MPFKSEKQRRYLWANEPEIARDWTDTYGSRIQKKNGGITQAGVLNYKDSDMVTVPKDWKSSPNHPDTQLAYITKAEKDLLVKKDLHGSLKDGPNMGPGGVMSLNGWGTKDAAGNEIGMSGVATSAAETGSRDPRDIKEVQAYLGPKGLPPGVMPKEADEYRIGFIQAGGSPTSTDSEEVKKTKKVKTKGGGHWLSPESHYNWALNLPGAKKNRLAHIKAYKDYLDAQGLDSSWIDPTDLSYQQFIEMKKFEAPQHRVDPTMAKNLGITPDYFPMDYKNFMLTHRKSPGIFMSGDLGNFWHQPNPKGAINPETGMPFTNTEWDMFKRSVIQDRGLATGGDDRGQEPFIPGGPPGDGDPGDGDPGDGDPGDGDGDGGTGSGIVYPYAGYGAPGYQTSDTFMNLAYPGGRNFLLARGGRVRAAFGGIMDTATGRKKYFLGSIGDAIGDAIGGVAKAAGKVLKSPIGKAAVLGLGAYYMPGFGIKATGGFGNMFNPSGFFGKALLKKGAEDWALKNLSAGKITGLMSLLPFTPLGKAPKNEDIGMADRGGRLTDPLTGKEASPAELRASLNDALSAAWNEDKQAYESEAMSAIRQAYPFLGQYPIYRVKDGGRIGAQEGGLMDLGGMEKDYRNEGGFVAIGGEERADDVPARLSRNEFVFTADAVRGAGGGDIDRGAEIMENVMKNLEQGGKISEESQGNTGAQEMFSVSQRIGEVL